LTTRSTEILVPKQENRVRTGAEYSPPHRMFKIFITTPPLKASSWILFILAKKILKNGINSIRTPWSETLFGLV
jgi:hypothetical protein